MSNPHQGVLLSNTPMEQSALSYTLLEVVMQLCQSHLLQ
jgi:hypothetical protein